MTTETADQAPSWDMSCSNSECPAYGVMHEITDDLAECGGCNALYERPATGA